MLSRNIFENPSEENLKLVKITLPNKLENLKASRKNYSSWKALQLMCLQLPRVYCGHSASCFIYFFCFKWSVKKNSAAKILLAIWETFFMKVIVNIMFSNFVMNLLLFFCFPFVKTTKKKKNKIFSIYWWCGNGNYLYFLFITSRALFQRHAEFNKLLLRNFFYLLILLVL